MSMNNLDLFPNDNVSEDGEKGEDRREGRCAVDDKEWNMVDFETIREVSNAGSSIVGVCNHYDFVSAIDEFGGKLVNVAFDASGCREKVVADHSNVVRHSGGLRQLPTVDGLEGFHCCHRRRLGVRDFECSGVVEK